MTSHSDGRTLPSMPNVCPQVIADLQAFCATHAVTPDELTQLLNAADLEYRLGAMRNPPGLWSKDVHDRYAGVTRKKTA